jgi:hypothetical protein
MLALSVIGFFHRYGPTRGQRRSGYRPGTVRGSIPERALLHRGAFQQVRGANRDHAEEREAFLLEKCAEVLLRSLASIH